MLEKYKLKKMVLSAMFLSVGLLLPFLTGQIRNIGHTLLPMHIPVLLCGFICGAEYGFLVGITVPLLRSFIFSMPVMYPNALAMAFELAVYGLLAGAIYSHSKKKNIISIYISLISAIISGRVVWGIMWMVFAGVSEGAFTITVFLTRAFANAVPGIILQLILIPTVVMVLKNATLCKTSG